MVMKKKKDRSALQTPFVQRFGKHYDITMPHQIEYIEIILVTFQKIDFFGETKTFLLIYIIFLILLTNSYFLNSWVSRFTQKTSKRLIGWDSFRALTLEFTEKNRDSEYNASIRCKSTNLQRCCMMKLFCFSQVPPWMLTVLVTADKECFEGPKMITLLQQKLPHLP